MESTQCFKSSSEWARINWSLAPVSADLIYIRRKRFSLSLCPLFPGLSLQMPHLTKKLEGSLVDTLLRKDAPHPQYTQLSLPSAARRYHPPKMNTSPHIPAWSPQNMAGAWGASEAMPFQFFVCVASDNSLRASVSSSVK